MLVVALGTLLFNFPITTQADECSQGNPDYLWDEKLKECLEIAGPSDPLAFTCKSHVQCTKSPLGELSWCSPETRRCECYDGDTDGRNPTVVYHGQCYVRKNLGEFCSDHVSCQAGIHPAAACANTPEFLPHEKVCICPEGQTCKTLGDPCKSNRDCQMGLGEDAECVMKVGEFQCDCKQGKVCDVMYVEEINKNRAIITSVIIIGIILVVIIIVALLVRFVRGRGRRSRRKSFVSEEYTPDWES